MVGEGNIADGKTSDFCTYWESNAALAGGVLVYNTGRSLGGFISLMQEKNGALALPDVLITAVGTKVSGHFLELPRSVLHTGCSLRPAAPAESRKWCFR